MSVKEEDVALRLNSGLWEKSKALKLFLEHKICQAVNKCGENKNSKWQARTRIKIQDMFGDTMVTCNTN